MNGLISFKINSKIKILFVAFVGNKCALNYEYYNNLIDISGGLYCNVIYSFSSGNK